jgi:hypothetical protein
MSSKFWDENRQSEYEQIEETYDEGTQAVLDELDGKIPKEEDMEEEYEDDAEFASEEDEEEYMDDYEATEVESAYKLDRRESGVVNESMVRLEQARLYDMLIKHDLFAGVKANPHALRNVQNELKSYIVDRLEILLGIKQEKTKREQPKEFIVDSPFNDVEIDFLKALSYKGTKGASAEAEDKQLIASEIQPLEDEYEEEYEEDNGLRPLGAIEEEPELAPVRRPVRKARPAPAPKPAPRKKKPVAAKPPARKKPVTKAPARKKKPSGKAPVATKTKGISRTSRRKVMSDKEAEELAREDMKRMAGYTKPAHEMTAKELLAANKKIAKQNTKVRPADAKEMANEAQASMLYQQQQLSQGNTGFNTLLQKVLHDKNK